MVYASGLINHPENPEGRSLLPLPPKSTLGRSPWRLPPVKISPPVNFA